DRAFRETHRQRVAIEPLPVAAWADVLLAFVPGIPPHFVAGLLLVEAAELQSRAETALAPAVLGIEREEARARLGKAAIANRASAFGREDFHAVRRRLALLSPARVAGASIDGLHVDDALPELERSVQRITQRRFGVHPHDELGDRKLDRVLAKAVEPRPA